MGWGREQFYREYGLLSFENEGHLGKRNVEQLQQEHQSQRSKRKKKSVSAVARASCNLRCPGMSR